MWDFIFSRERLVALAAVVLFASALGCPPNMPSDVEPATLDFSINPTSASVGQGSSTDVALTARYSSGDFSPPALSVGGAPAGVTGVFSNTRTVGLTTTATLTISVGGAVTPGTHNLSVRADAPTGEYAEIFTLTVTEVEPAYELSATPADLTIVQDGEGISNIAIARTNFADDVTLAVEGAPSGMTTSFDTNPVSVDAAVLTMAPDATVAAGVYTLTVRGTAVGLTDRTASVEVTVSEPSAFDYALAVNPASLTIDQGAAEDATITVTRTSFTGPVTLSAEGVPVDVSVAFSDNPVTGNTSEMTVTVASNVAPGSYSFTVRGTATGLPDKTVTVDLQVDVPSAGQLISLDFSVCVADQRPVWFAFQDGSDPWNPTPGTGDAYTFFVNSTTVAIAVATDQGGASNVIVVYATRAELALADLREVCDVAATGKTATASVSGVNPAVEGAAISLGDAVVEAVADGPVTFTAVPDGNLDLVAYRWSFSVSERMLLRRDLDPAPGSDIGSIDFAGPDAFFPDFAAITVLGGSGTGLQWLTEYATSPSPGVCYYAPLDDDLSIGNTFSVGGAPLAQQQSGDFHVVTVTDGLHTVSEMFATLAPRTISFGQALPTPTITDITGTASYRRIRVELTLPAEYDSNATISLVDNTGDHAITAIATPGWMGGLDVSIEIPDFTGLSQWDDLWAPTSASQSSWAFSAYGWTGDDCTEDAREVTTILTGTVG